MEYTPFLLVFHITGRCNLQCAYCYASSYDQTDLKTEVVQDVLSQAAELGTRHVILSGGEPLLHPGFYEFAEYANNRRLKVHMTSNGTMIDETAAENLKAQDVNVTISLDGSSPEYNDPLRGAGTFKRAMNSIDNLINSGVYTSMRMTLVKQNVTDVRNYIELAKRHRVNRCIIERITGVREIPQSFILEPSAADVLQTFKIMSEYQDTFNVGSNDPLWLLFRKEVLEKYANTAHICGGCTAGVAAVVINPDLAVTPCPRLPITAGNLKEASLEDIWHNSDVLQNLRNRDLFDGCASCSYKYICGGCRGAAHAHGSYLGKDPQCWRVNR